MNSLGFIYILVKAEAQIPPHRENICHGKIPLHIVVFSEASAEYYECLRVEVMQ